MKCFVCVSVRYLDDSIYVLDTSKKAIEKWILSNLTNNFHVIIQISNMNYIRVWETYNLLHLDIEMPMSYFKSKFLCLATLNRSSLSYNIMCISIVSEIITDLLWMYLKFGMSDALEDGICSNDTSVSSNHRWDSTTDKRRQGIYLKCVI